jgi:hypothetical protein
MQSTIPKTELKRIIKRMMDDPDRGISLQLFSDLAGINKSTLVDVFVKQTLPLSEYVQRRVSKAYTAWKNGQVAVMQNRDRTRFVEYRRQPKPPMARAVGLQVVNGEIKLNVGIKNINDYSEPTLEEQLRG